MCSLKHPQVTITQKRTINPAMHVMECPKCGKIVASASERYLLPQSATCLGMHEFNKITRKKTTLIKKYIPVTLGVGSTVEHRNFGKGVILTEDEKRVDVDFEKSGKKNLLKQFANLKLVKNA